MGGQVNVSTGSVVLDPSALVAYAQGSSVPVGELIHDVRADVDATLVIPALSLLNALSAVDDDQAASLIDMLGDEHTPHAYGQWVEPLSRDHAISVAAIARSRVWKLADHGTMHAVVVAVTAGCHIATRQPELIEQYAPKYPYVIDLTANWGDVQPPGEPT
jgi:hypothetical protein